MISFTYHQVCEQFQGKLTAQGKLLLQDTLPIAEHNPNKPDLKFKGRRIFLFEQIIIFSEVIESKNPLTPDHYVFKHAIKVSPRLCQLRFKL
mgnify:CR=1 FL=1